MSAVPAVVMPVIMRGAIDPIRPVDGPLVMPSVMDTAMMRSRDYHNPRRFDEERGRRRWQGQSRQGQHHVSVMVATRMAGPEGEAEEGVRARNRSSSGNY